jgi:ferredoxin-NADP reductase
MAIPAWQKCIVKRTEQVTFNTRRFWLEFPEVESFDFKPGQFITFDLPVHEQRNKRWRSYSISSVPDGSNIVELILVYFEKGLGSQYLFNTVKEGSELLARGPQGVFTLPEVLDKELFMICTGTGIAPFRSMLQYVNKHKISHNGLHLIFGTRTQSDLLYEAEMRELEKTLPGFKYYATLSREQREGYHNGYVHPIYESICANQQPAAFYLCGWREMIDEAKERIQKLGYDKKTIHQELYG